MVLPGIGSHSPLNQSFGSYGWASSAAVSWRIGVITRSCSTPSTSGAMSENLLAIARKMFQSLFVSHAGSTAAERGWMNGCMSDVLRSCFSYQVAVGRTTSEYMLVVDIRKSMLTIRSSFPTGASSRQTTSFGRSIPAASSSVPITP